MTLIELRATLKTHLFDWDETSFTNGELDVFLNAAMRHVASLLGAADTGHLIVKCDELIPNPAPVERIIFVTPGTTIPTTIYTSVRRIVYAERRDLANDDEPSLEIITFESARFHVGDSLQEKPPVFVYNNQLGFVQPVDNVRVWVWYLPQLPSMIADSDTPGQSGGMGNSDMLPVEYQHLIPVYAAVLALGGENRETTGWRATFSEMVEAMGLSARERVETPEAG